MKVESICIVGGGSAGWMTAALLSKETDMEICLIESANQKPIGVGESTIQHINRYLQRLGIKDKDWMPHCNATYKAAIAFKDFRQKDTERFYYPFAGLELPPWNQYFKDEEEMLLRWQELRCMYPDLYPPEEFSFFINKQTNLAHHNIMCDSIPDTGFNIDDHIAYHFNADKFGEWLAHNIALPNGVVHALGDVNNVIKTPDGNISAITTVDGQCISADLFVDCTGFKSLLLEQHMGQKFISFEDQLFNDSAIVTHVDYRDKVKQMKPYTDCVALKHGWVYNIPQWENIGTGYVYSSKYINECEAEIEFKEFLDAEYTPTAQNCPFNSIKIKHGKHERGWVNNVVAVGLSYAFLEPLESTGLMTTHECAQFLGDALTRRDGYVSRIDRDVYNHASDSMIDKLKNFIVIHYNLTQRDDTQYWRDCAEKVEVNLESMGDVYSGYDDYVKLLDAIGVRGVNDMSDGQLYIVNGMGVGFLSKGIFNERSSQEMKDVINETHELYQRDKEDRIQWVNKQQSHYELSLIHI